MYVKKMFLLFCSLFAYSIESMNDCDVSESFDANKFIKEEVERTGEYQSFKALQQIFKVNRELCKAFQLLSAITADEDQTSDEQAEYIGVNPHYGQTQQGFLLLINEVPDELWTPWGAISLATLYKYRQQENDLFFKAFGQAFLKNFKISFMGGTLPLSCTDKSLKFYELVNSRIDLKKQFITNTNVSHEKLYRVLSQDEMLQRAGKETLIWADGLAGTVYEILEVNGVRMPKVMVLSQEQSYRSHDAIKFIWKLMEDMYKREKNNIK